MRSLREAALSSTEILERVRDIVFSGDLIQGPRSKSRPFPAVPGRICWPQALSCIRSRMLLFCNTSVLPRIPMSVSEKPRNNGVILRCQHGARHVEQPPARRFSSGQSAPSNRRLQPCQLVNIGGPPQRFDVRMAADDATCRTRRIKKDRVERAFAVPPLT